MRYLRKVSKVVTILSLVVYFLAYGIPQGDPVKIAQAAGDFTISGMVYNNGQPVWDGFGVKITGSRGTTLWATTSGGYYQFNGFSSGTYTLGHNQDCPSNTPADITISGSYTFNIYLECPNPKPKVTVWGRVVIDGKGAYDTFTVRLKNKETGQEYWPKVSGGDGWYSKEGVEQGWYTITHWHDCPGNNNFDAWIGVGAETAPEINLTCTQPKPKVTLWGRVVIDGKGAYDTFTVRLKNKESGQEYWPKVSNGDGWYFKEGVEEGTYTFTHWHDCPGNNNFDAWIGVGAETAPEINLTCTQPKQKVTVWGRVVIDGVGAYDTFTVRLLNKDTGQEYWPKVAGGDGWYSKQLVEEGTYLITHWHDCPGNNNFETRIGVGSETVPEINLTCTQPKPKHTLSGKVTIDGVPAYKGFGVLLEGYGWYIINNDEGRYTFNNIPEGRYTVRHNFNICPTNEGNPQMFQVDGRAGPNFSIVCPKVEPVPPIIEVPLQPTCSEILSELGITSASIALVDQEETMYLPIVIGNSSVTPINPRPVVGYEMDQETFIRLGTQLDDIEKYITVANEDELTVLSLDAEQAGAAGFEPMLIDLATQQVESINAFLEGGENYNEEDYPLLQEFNAAATRNANSPQVASVSNEVRGLSIEQCVCGSKSFPRPSYSVDRKFEVFDTREQALGYLTSNNFHDTPDIELQGFPNAGWTRPQTWMENICGKDTYRDDGSEYPSTTYPGKWTVAIQDYSGISPRGEPNPEFWIHGGVANWPYVLWLDYVRWWHSTY